MKKTLITLMALAGVAMAETTTMTNSAFNAYIDQALLDAGYIKGYEFNLSFKVDSFTYSNGLVLTLGPDYFMVAQKPTAGAFLGLSFKDVGNDLYMDATTSANPSFVTDSAIYKTDATAKKTEWVTNDGDYLYSWITCDPGVNQSQPKYIVDATFNIGSNGKDSFISVQLADGKLFDVTLTGVALNANDLEIGEKITGVSNVAMTIVPEPATATLSLLALAGLAARRRRK